MHPPIAEDTRAAIKRVRFLASVTSVSPVCLNGKCDTHAASDRKRCVCATIALGFFDWRKCASITVSATQVVTMSHFLPKSRSFSICKHTHLHDLSPHLFELDHVSTQRHLPGFILVSGATFNMAMFLLLTAPLQS